MTDTRHRDGFQGMRVAFVAKRIAGKGGMSPKIEKWVDVLERPGSERFYTAGECDRSVNKTTMINLAHFSHSKILDMTRRAVEPVPHATSLTDEIMTKSCEIYQTTEPGTCGFLP